MRKFVELNKKVLKDKRCKQCKELFTPRSSMQYICSTRCALNYKSAMNWKKEKTKMKITTHAKEYKSDLQREINKLARMIDSYFSYNTCICCDKGFGKQTDGAHFHSVGSNNSVRYNLHNIHSANSFCNNYSNTHISNYKIGLENRYGYDYANFVINEIPLKYKEMKLSSIEVVEKLKITRSLIKHFDTYKLITSQSSRDLFNNLIGIYK